MTIDRCICFQQRFADLKAVADAQDVHDVAALQAHVAFGMKCRLCHPYVRRMLRTGETVFHEIVTEADEPA
jgi:bacterioferritin-associated ferredoxin